MAGSIGDWIIRPENRYVVEHSYRGGKTQFDILDTKLKSFESHKLVDNIKNSPLGHMYTAMSYFNYNYALPYHLLVRSVYTDINDELLIRLGNNTCRFGRTEFALISGLSFRELDPVGRSMEELPPSSLIAKPDCKTGLVDLSRTPFLGPLEHISIAILEKALVNATNPDTAYKVGLIYLIEAVMYGKDSRMAVSPFVFGLVDDTSRFLSYPWGRFFWDLSMDIWKGKRDKMKIPFKGKGKKRKGMDNKKDEAKGKNVNGKDKIRDDIASLMVVLFAWAYETLPHSVVSKLAIQDNEVDIPRVLRWRPHVGRVQEKTLSRLLEGEALDVKRYLEPNDAEVRMLRANGLTEDDIKSQPPIYPPPVVAVPAPVAPPPAKHATVDATTHAGASSEAIPSGARDIHSDIGDLRNTVNNFTDEMLGKIEIVRGVVRRGQQESIDMIDEVRNELTVSNESMVKHISRNKAEETEQNRVIMEDIQRIWGLISQQNRVSGVDPIEPSHAAAHSEYPREHARVYQPAFQPGLDPHKAVDASLNEVMGEESHLSEANVEDTFSLGDDRMGKGSSEVISYLKPSDVEVDMLRRLGLTDDEINTPPPLYTFPHDVCHPHEFVSPVSAPISDTDHVAACSKHVNAFDTSPNKSNATVSGITQLRTDLLGWRSCALSMHEEVSQDVKDATKDVRDNIDGVRHDIKYSRKLIHADLENMMNDSRNHFIGIRSKLSAMESLLNRQQFTRPPPQSSTPFMGKPNELPSQLGHQHTRDDHKLPHKKNQQQQGVDMNSDKKEQAGSASKITPCRQFRPCPPPPQPQPLRKHELSFHVVNRPTEAKKDGTTKSKKKKQLGSSLHDHGPDLSVHNSLGSEVAEKPLWEDAYKPRPPEPRELWPDPQVEVNYNETPHHDEVVIDLCMRNSLYQEKPKGNGLHDPVLIPDSSHSDPPTPVTKMVISAELPECPRSRRPTMRPGKLQDYVDPSTVARNKRKRYEPYRPIDLSKWLELRAWYNDPDALNMEIQGVFWNLTKPMDDASPYWFETLYTSQKWLGVTHIDAYLYLLLSRMQEHRSSFNDNVSIFSHSLGVLLLSESRMKSPDGTDRSVLEALCGLTEKSIVYTPWVFSSHWVALVISIPSWDVTVYDCLYGKGQNNEMDNKLRFLATSMAMLLKNSHDLKDDPRISQPFMVKRLGCDACPQMSEVGDCGVFTAKHIEHLILKDADLKDVKQENMDAFRDKMCVDIFHRNMDL